MSRPAYGGGADGVLRIPSNHRFATNALRDSYFGFNPGELTEGRLVTVNGVLQEYLEGSWVDTGTVTQGEPGNDAPQVLIQYSPTGTDDWSNTQRTTDTYWRWSTNGGATWSSDSIKYKALAIQVQYSTDGATGWTDTMDLAHNYWRLSVDGGVTWSLNNTRLRAYELMVQYSEDGTTGWTSVLDAAHRFWRWSNDGGTTWSADGVKFRGVDGAGTDFSAIPVNHIPAIGVGGTPVDSGLALDNSRDLRTPGSLTIGPSSLYLGDSFRISNGVEALSLQLGSGVDALGVNSTYDNTGSKAPLYYDLGTRTDLTVASVSTGTVPDGWGATYTTVGNNLTYDFFLIPAEAGELRVRFWEGTDTTGKLIFDETRIFTQNEVDVAAPVRFGVGNKYIMQAGKQIYVQFNGISMRGGTQTNGPFNGQPAPYFRSEIQAYDKVGMASTGVGRYGNTAGTQQYSPDQIVILRNDGAGSNNTDFLPNGPENMIDANGRILTHNLGLGDTVNIRFTVEITPNSMGQVIEAGLNVGGSTLNPSVAMGPKYELKGGAGVMQSFSVIANFQMTHINTLTRGLQPYIRSSGTGQVRCSTVSFSVVRRNY